MEKNEKLAGAGMIAAITASICCIGPLLAITAGIGGVASVFTWIEPLRPYFIGITVLTLGFAWYGQLKPKRDIDCECEEEGGKKKFMQTKSFLTIVTVASVILLSFPYYSSVFTPQNDSGAVENRLSTVELKISGMTCEGCEANIKNYAQAAGADSVSADYKLGNAVIKFDESKTSVDSILASIKTLGYKIKDVKIK